MYVTILCGVAVAVVVLVAHSAPAFVVGNEEYPVPAGKYLTKASHSRGEK